MGQENTRLPHHGEPGNNATMMDPSVRPKAPPCQATPDGVDKFAFIRALRGRTDLTLAEYRLLVTLWSYTDEHGRGAYAGPARLAADVGLDPKNGARDVKNRLRSLELRGYVCRASDYVAGLLVEP